ncbi:hypothetical protein GUITHDRAFT_162315 [Guillardia theta CCMP2712]|uniref:Uncharacterized protein n=1 Tax=Guillardia theta (strain CCMP2712) TaxID=905079 RepID=L1JKH5_GUITC|nr:hypothetical protein GUITHDRAFT_162315 [Guillardia theta CCMP2712]EKX48802.1 hypothetical protein GUITHDRAFT_162315 [Guillardia theta CCMP2712]|eukprot:XP_005835782.1 hypothetical protein GUITHDRAFT_162315 [Guillardia theta CCMP2712]
MAGCRQTARLLAAMAAISCMAVMIGVVTVVMHHRSMLKQVKLTNARSALKAEINRQHKIGSQIKAWVAASAMKSNGQALKARFQQLMDDSSVPIPLEPEFHAARHAFPMRRRSSLKVVPSDDQSKNAKGGNAELEAALEKAVLSQAQRIKELEDKIYQMSDKKAAAPAKEGKKAAAPAKEGKKAHRRVKHKPALGSWDAAIAANSAEAGAGALGTNVAYLYNDLQKKGRHFEVSSKSHGPDLSNVDVHGKGDFSRPQEEDVDYWNEDEAQEPKKTVRSTSVRSAEVASKSENSAPAAEEQPATAADEEEEEKYLDQKPPLGSWEMAKFANNVEAGGGSLGTNVAYMYDSLSNKGHYKEVNPPWKEVEDGSSVTESSNDDEFDPWEEYKATKQQKLAQRRVKEGTRPPGE